MEIEEIKQSWGVVTGEGDRWSTGWASEQMLLDREQAVRGKQREMQAVFDDLLWKARREAID
jgi:hypothetical protein